MKTPDGAVAWFCTERTTGKLSERKLIEPCVATNHAYVLAHRGHNWQPLIPAASLDALRAERDADRLRYLQMSHERDAILDQLQAAESKLAAVGALADSWYARKALDGSNAQAMREKTYEQCADELRTLIAEAGTGDNDNSEVTK